MASTERPTISKKQAVQEYLAAQPDATAQEIIEALKQQGLEIAESTIYNVKWANNRDSSAAPPRRKKSVSVAAIETDAAPSAAGPVNKTQAVKAYLARDPKATPLEISAALGAQGIDVAPNYAAGIKSSLKAKKRGKKAASKAASPAPSAASSSPADDTISLDALRKAKSLVRELGGLDQARQALKALSVLLD
jgi:hypothetical protein